MGGRSLVVCLLVWIVPGYVRAEGGPALVQFSERDNATAGWKAQATKNGVTLEKREVPGSSYYEYRAVVDVAVDPARAAEELWSAMRGGDMEDLKHRQILRASDHELLIYDQIRTPVVSDRDYTIRIRRVYDPARQRTQFRAETANELGPPPAHGYVRVPMIRAGWMTEPDGHGGTRLTHYAYSEPGGYVAAFLVRGAQADRSLADVLRMIQRLRRAPQRR
ncbi:MAG TPA: START domain-containing protein [Polyangia bacterium]|jgi:hypothetical protein|nr:START domain-containing protein [Polyangia bacterium]